MRSVRILSGLLVVVVCLGVGILISNPASSQDDFGPRIEALEVRVTLLEATVSSINDTSLPAATPVPEKFKIRGEFTLGGDHLDDYMILGSSCVGLGGYEDIGVGAQVRVTDASGSVLGVGQLEPGKSSENCEFTFTIEVPRSDFYTVSAGATRRGGITYSFAEMESNGWKVELFLG